MGDWYWDDRKITTSTQTFYTRPHIQHVVKFIKTAGIDDSYITCTVDGTLYDWGGAIVGVWTQTLNYMGSGTWETTLTFDRPGRYELELKATDGTKTITYSILFVTSGQKGIEVQFPISPIRIGFMLVGFAMMLYGTQTYKKLKLR
jgi:hypothetical protein